MSPQWLIEKMALKLPEFQVAGTLMTKNEP